MVSRSDHPQLAQPGDLSLGCGLDTMALEEELPAVLCDLRCPAWIIKDNTHLPSSMTDVGFGPDLTGRKNVFARANGNKVEAEQLNDLGWHDFT